MNESRIGESVREIENNNKISSSNLPVTSSYEMRLKQRHNVLKYRNEPLSFIFRVSFFIIFFFKFYFRFLLLLFLFLGFLAPLFLCFLSSSLSCLFFSGCFCCHGNAHSISCGCSRSDSFTVPTWQLS